MRQEHLQGEVKGDPEGSCVPGQAEGATRAAWSRWLWVSKMGFTE